MSAGNSVHPHACKPVRKGTSDADFGEEHTTLCGSFRRLVRRQRGVSQRFIWHLNFGIGREGSVLKIMPRDDGNGLILSLS